MKPYACHGQPRPVVGTVTHQAQAGWENAQLPDVFFNNGVHRTRVPIMAPMTYVFESACMYDRSHADVRCADCLHVKKE